VNEREQLRLGGVPEADIGTVLDHMRSMRMRGVRVEAADVAAAMRPSTETLDNLGLRLWAPRPPEPSDALVAQFTRLYGAERGRATAAAIVAWRDRPRREAEFRQSALRQLERANARAAVNRAATAHRAGLRTRLRASVRALVLGET